MSILKEQVGKREEGELSISPEINHYIWDRGAENPPTKIVVEVVDQDGSKRVQLAGSETEEASTQQEPESTEQEESDEDEEYEEVLDGTVSEAKEAVRELDDPDHERLLELEKQGKDRKTLKEFLESR